MDLTAAPIEDILDAAATSSAQITVWLSGHSLAGARIAAWSRHDRILVCRGGNGFTDDDIHYIRSADIQALTVRVPAPRPESDRLGAEVRDAIRHAAGYPVSLAIRPDAFANAAAPLAAWLENITLAITAMEPLHEAFQAQIDQILLREGATPAVLGGSTLILEATPDNIPSPEVLRAAIEPLLL
ncbi:MAG: hypothetical protein HYX27_19845 [Acidobacteria bacterium]|nr:hypothetical protein [Acidobacteriota bacterium]